jgi:transposase InsO family protein
MPAKHIKMWTVIRTLMPSSVIRIRELCKMAGIKKSRTTPYHPAGNGQCERFNSNLLGMLGTLNDEQKVNLKNYLSSV